MASAPFGGAANVLCLMLQNLADLRHQLGFRHADLCHTRLAPARIVLDFAGEALAFDQILDLHDAFGALVTALDDGDGRAEAIGIFQLVAEFLPVALVHFGADALGAQRLGEALVTAHALHIAVHDGDEDGCERLDLPKLASIVVGKILDKNEDNYGYNAQTGEYGDLIALGIVDPVKVVRTALQNAASVASLLITTEAMIAELPKKESAMPQMPGGGMGGMDF